METGVYGVHTVNETRARYSRQRSRQNGDANLPTTVVLDAFTGGGPPLTLSFTNQDRLEVQNTTTVTHGTHLLRWGGRLRGIYLKDQDTQNYTGTFTFSSLDSYRLTLLGQQSGLTPAADSGERRRRQPVLHRRRESAGQPAPIRRRRSSSSTIGARVPISPSAWVCATRHRPTWATIATSHRA